MLVQIKNTTNEGDKRIASIDCLRGISILGIFLVNIFAYHTPYLYVDQTTLATSQTDKFIFSMIDIFIQASFYPLFAMLFGYGLIMIKEKADIRGQSFRKIASKRMLILLVFGFIHAFLIWPGDILITYAIFGFIIIPFTKLSEKAMAVVAILLYLIPTLLSFLFVWYVERFIESSKLSILGEKQTGPIYIKMEVS